MKKLITLLLCLVMTVSLFAGCGGGGGLVENTGEAQTQGTVDKNQQIPDDYTLVIGMPRQTMIKDFDTNAYTLWLEEVTGYNIELHEFQSGSADYRVQLSSMLATDDELPDILMNFDLASATYKEYGDSGYFINLAPYYNDKEVSAEFWGQMEKLKELNAEQYELVLRKLNFGGNMYAYPRVEYSDVDTMNFQTYINKEWLKTLGLKAPTTTQELYNVLVAFRDRDPNGNRKKDELPLISGLVNGESAVIQWIINMFIYCNNDKWFNVDENNQLYLPHLTDAYREALIFINKLYKEKLINNTILTYNNRDVAALLNKPAGEDVQVGIVIGHPTNTFDVDNPTMYQYEALPYWGNVTRSAYYLYPNCYITEDCEYPLAAWEVLMAMTSPEGTLRQRYGEKGVDWEEADPGTKSFLGLDAEIKVLDENAFMGQNNSCWHKIMATVLIYSENETVQRGLDDTEWATYKYKLMGDCYWNYKEAEEKNNPEAKYLFPTDVVIPEEVTAADSNQKSAATALIKEATSQFCVSTGDYNDPTDDAQWAKYLAAMEATGYKTWLNNRQVVYEAAYPDRVPAK